MCSSRYSNSSPRFGGLASRCTDQEKPRGGHREREDGAAPKRGEDRCIFPSFAPSIANRLHEGARDEWGNDQAQAWKPTWRQKSVWKNECADDATNRTDDSPAQYCEDWIRLACATEACARLSQPRVSTNSPSTWTTSSKSSSKRISSKVRHLEI